jgi:SAM-dependent methyltransferase
MCRGDLVVDPDSDGAMGDVNEGALSCVSCRVRYPVRGGIPRFPMAAEGTVRDVTERTGRRYTFAWRRFGDVAAAQRWEKDSYRYVDLIPKELTSGVGKIGLDAGCGAGLDVIHMATGGADIIAFDLSDGVETASRLTRHLPNVEVVQGDLNAVPFRPESFDFIYSFGVLHHLADPVRGFRALGQLLKPGAPLITYLYEDFSDRSRVERLVLRAIRLVRRVTSRLPASLLYALCCLGAPAVWLTCAVPARILAPIVPAVASRIPFRHTLRWNVLASDLFDRFAPPMEFRYDVARIRELYRAAGIEDVQSRRYRGWVSWGCRTAPVMAGGRG